METESFFVDTFDRISRVLAAALDGVGPGIALSIDIGGSFFDLIAGDAAASAGLEFIRAPSLQRYRSKLWDNRLTSKAYDIVAEPAMFGRVDGYLRTIDDAGALKGYVMSGADIATRRLDSWLAGRPKLQFVHFGDAMSIHDQVWGAYETLTQDRPIVTLYPAGNAREQLLQLFGKLRYQAFDLAGQYPERNGVGTPPGFGWILVPKERGDALSAFAAGQNHDISGSSQSDRRVLDRSATARQRRSSELFGIHTFQPLELAHTIAISDIVSCNDCYRLETDGANLWRWLGPRARSRIAVPCAFPGAYEFELSVLNCRTKNGLKDCRIFVNGLEASTSVNGIERGTVKFAGYLDAEGYEGHFNIDIVSPGAFPYVGSDTRILRTSISSIAISSWH